jgi:mannitol/fructose-specific phosphotransferase system IIA component (Ntr-type)
MDDRFHLKALRQLMEMLSSEEIVEKIKSAFAKEIILDLLFEIAS